MKKLFAMEKWFALGYLERIENATAEEKKLAQDQFDGKELPSILEIKGDTAIISISGPLSQEGPSWIDMLFGYGGTSYKSIIESLEIVGKNENINNVRLKMNTPGGAVNGVDEVYQAVETLCKNKSVVAENCGMVASAGYWIASAADRIIATARTNETGSIGVIIVAFDFSEMEKQMGIKRIKIVSRNAENKSPDPATKKGRDVLQDRVDSIERIFIDRVASGRGIETKTVVEKFGKGGLFIAEDPDKSKDDAVSIGMIDALEEINAKKKPKEHGFNAEENINHTTEIKKNQSEGSKMTLKEFLKDNPEAAERVEAIKAENLKAGREAATKEFAARVEKASSYIGNAEYPKAIQDLAVKVLKGDEEISSLNGAVSYHDTTIVYGII